MCEQPFFRTRRVVSRAVCGVHAGALLVGDGVYRLERVRNDDDGDDDDHRDERRHIRLEPAPARKASALVMAMRVGAAAIVALVRVPGAGARVRIATVPGRCAVTAAAGAVMLAPVRLTVR